MTPLTHGPSPRPRQYRDWWYAKYLFRGAEGIDDSIEVLNTTAAAPRNARDRGTVLSSGAGDPDSGLIAPETHHLAVAEEIRFEEEDHDDKGPDPSTEDG
jgi:hypothetical protein